MMDPKTKAAAAADDLVEEQIDETKEDASESDTEEGESEDED